jgi:non-ribosomal peptide synthetase component E (peptide arylation enzyme)
MSATPNDLSVAQLLQKAADTYGDKEVIYDLQKRLSYTDLQRLSNCLAEGLYQLGIRKGDRIGVCLPNWHETAVIFFAAAKLGAAEPVADP